MYPVLGYSALPAITFALGAAWTLLMSVAVVGAFWHTPLDDIGSVLLSVGFVTAGAALLGPKKRTPGPPVEAEPEPVTVGVLHARAHSAQRTAHRAPPFLRRTWERGGDRSKLHRSCSEVVCLLGVRYCSPF